MKAIHDLLHLLNNLRERIGGDSLGRVALDKREERELHAGVSRGFELGLSRLDAASRKRWGAAALLLGARALRAAAEGPFSYDRISAHVSLWPRHLDQPQYNALEDGAKLWGIEIMRVVTARGPQRRFLGTLIRQSGAGWVLLEKLAALVARQQLWDWIVSTELETIAAWIDLHARRTLGERVERALDEETREALAARLQDLANVRALLGQNATPEAALQTFGANELAAALDAPSTDATRRMLEHLCPSSDDEACGAPRWQWHLDGRGYERAVIALPQRLRPPDDLPLEVHEFRVQLLDDLQPRSALYVRVHGRDGRRDLFEHREGPRIRLPRNLQAQLLAQFRDGRDTGEVVVAELAVPTAPIAVFDAERGRLLRHPRAGTRVALVLAPGWRLHAPAGFLPGGKEPLEAWIGTMSDHDLACELSGPDDETQSWTLSATPPPLELTLTNAVPGLRLAHAPVVCGAPEFRSNIMRGKGTCTVRRNGESLGSLQVVVRGGRLKLSSASPSTLDWPQTGVFSLDFSLRSHTCTERVAVLPADTRAEVLGGPGGTTAALSGPTLHARLRTLSPDLPTQEGKGRLTLSPVVRGQVVLHCELAGTPWLGVWRLFARPQIMEVVDTEGAVRDGEDDLSALRSGGGLRVYGEPRTIVQLQIEDERWSLRLSPNGERVFPFREIPSAMLQRMAEQKQVEQLRIHVRWPDHSEQKRAFAIPHNKKPLVRIVPGEDGAPPRLRVAWSRRPPGEVHIEAVRAWQPWAPSVSLPAQAATWPDLDGKAGYEAEAPLEPGSYQVALFSGERQLSGATLVFCPDGTLPPPPPHFSRLEAELWDNPDIRKLPPLLDQWSEEGKDEMYLPGLLRNLTRVGIKWFRIAEILPEITGSWRLETLLREDPSALDSLITDYYEQTGLAWMFVRDRDLECVAGRLYMHGSGAANKLLACVAELDAGLLCAAARAWGHLLSFEGQHRDQTIELQRQLNAYKEPRRISPDERAWLTEPDLEPDPNKLCVPRLLGLQQLNRHAAALSAGLGELDIPTNERRSTPPRFDPAWFDRLPERLQELERAAATWAWAVHLWRRGETMTYRTMRALSRIEPLARRSFDYWLNSWDRIDPQKSGDHR
ncbi:hypothetical protein [Nannocystis bainbridge]|uniref:Uncharacterized protein n=1 Tax=Nannocystis bainbridge TaxID=2995303 RepID=A0ABT5DR78_9BACT|nr:hypothetical protein [Nannocystis bainbridge]MDC0716157.1 hypothetical protein [Nannocystis bainbridge]